MTKCCEVPATSHDDWMCRNDEPGGRGFESCRGAKIQGLGISKPSPFRCCGTLVGRFIHSLIRSPRAELSCLRGQYGVTRALSLGLAKPEFALAPHAEHENRVYFGHEPIKRQVTAGARCNHQFAFAIFHRPPNQRTGFQHIQRGNNSLDPIDRGIWRMLKQEVEYPLKIIPQLRGKNYLRHLRALGARAILPLARVLRYARMSCHGIPAPDSIISAKRVSASP